MLSGPKNPSISNEDDERVDVGEYSMSVSEIGKFMNGNNLDEISPEELEKAMIKAGIIDEDDEYD